MMTSASWMAAAAHRRREGGAELEDRHRLNMGTEALHRAGGGTGELAVDLGHSMKERLSSTYSQLTRTQEFSCYE